MCMSSLPDAGCLFLLRAGWLSRPTAFIHGKRSLLNSARKYTNPAVELESMSGCGLPANYITDVSLHVSTLLHLYPTSRVYIASVTYTVTSRRIPALRLHITLTCTCIASTYYIRRSDRCSVDHTKRCHARASDL